MSFRNRQKVEFFLTWRKLLSSRANVFLLAGFLLILLFVWVRDSFQSSFTFFLYLYPYFFLFVSQGMVRDETESGALENVVFLDGHFRRYLLMKNASLGIAGAALSLFVFSVYAFSGLAMNAFNALHLVQFLIGIIVGCYYLSLGMFLGHFLKGGSNVLILVILQAAAFLLILFTSIQSPGFVDFLDSGSLPDLASRMKFAGLVVLFPNLTISRNFFLYSLEVGALIVFFLWLQGMRIRRLELMRK